MTTDQPATSNNSEPILQGDIVARAGRYYRNTRYLMFVLLVGMGGWFAYDGWVKYPAENAIVQRLEADQKLAQERGDDKDRGRIAAELKQHEFHNDAALNLQRLLGFALPPLGLLLLLWALRNSRGEYRMSGTKISIPGHPTIDLSNIKSVNNTLWDRKGLAWVKYELTGGQAGEFKLDDFVYDRPPTDAIYDRIARHMGLGEEDQDDDGDDDRVADDEDAEGKA